MISSFLEISFSARMESERPSKIMTLLGSQEWLIKDARGSKAMPMGSKVGVTRVMELIMSCDSLACYIP